jgi:hypothetical protein
MAGRGTRVLFARLLPSDRLCLVRKAAASGVDRDGGFRMIQRAPEWNWPSALTVDRTGNVIVS